MLQHSRRRFLTGALGATAAAAAPALLTGCAGRASADDGPLKFWNFYAPQRQENPAVNAQSKWFEKLVADWNATHERKVELVYVPTFEFTNGAKLPTAFAAGAGPDIFLVSPGDFLRYYNGGVLADLTPYMDKEAVEDFYPDVISSRSVDGKIFALPMEAEPLAMYYPQDVWEKAGLSEGDIPTTWDEMLDVGARLARGHRAGLVFEPRPGYFQNFTWYPWLWQGGGDVVRDGRQVFDGKSARQALNLWKTSVEEGITPRTLPASGDLTSGFKAGLAGMWMSGIWEVANLREFAPKLKYGVFRLPLPKGGKYVTAHGGWAFGANALGKDPEAAAEFCAFALGSSRRECVKRIADWCTVAKTDMPPRKSVLELAERRGGFDFWAMRKFRDEIFAGARAEPRYPPVVYKAVSDAIQSTMLAGGDVDAQTERAAQSIDAYLKSYQGASLI